MKVKQNSFQVNTAGRGSLALLVFLCFLCTSLRADQARNPPKGFGGAVATVSLSAQSAAEGGVYRSAVVVTMPSGSHTYWKDPGDAGVPPVFAFNGSTNVAKAEVLFPAPVRIKEEGLEAIGYADHVAFPVKVTLADAGKPAILHLDMTYAVCNKICVPGHANADLALPVKSGADDAAVAAAFTTVPRPLSQVDRLVIAPLPSKAKPSWTITWNGDTPIRDVFATAPEGYAFETRQTQPGSWTLMASQTVPAAKSTPVPVGLTLSGARQNFETVRTIDLPASAP